MEFGEVGTSDLYEALFPNGLSQTTEITDSQKLSRIIYILQGGFYTARGISPGGLDGIFGNSLTNAIKTFQSQAGITQDGIVTSYLMKAILTTDSFELDSSKGDNNIRGIQQALNAKYYPSIDIIPTNGIYERQTNRALIKALQLELGLDADGIWGNQTMAALPTLQRYGTVTNRQVVYILQYSLYINSFDPNGFDGAFGAGVQTAVKNFQSFVGLTSDGICGKQTWASLLVSYGDPNRTATACDCVSEITNARAQTLKNAGYMVVGRYLTNARAGNLDKNIKEGEINTIINAGLTIFPIYQTTGNYAEYFNKGRGLSDAEYAYQAAKKYGFKEGTIIYFAVDFDALETDITERIIPYFQGINEKFEELDNYYEIGIYGARGVCTETKNNNLTVASFVSDTSSGFSANIGHILPSDWKFDQIATISLGSGDGFIEIDKNVTNTTGSSQFNNSESVFNYTEDTFIKPSLIENNKSEVVNAVTELLNTLQYLNALKKPSEVAELVFNADEIITEISNLYKVRKALIQTVFMWESSCIRADDSAADLLVEAYYNYKNELEEWENLSEEEQENTPEPIEPVVSRDDSSTGICQIFAKTAIDAYNYNVKRCNITGTELDSTDWKTVYNVWKNLKDNSNYSLQMAALVLLRGADLVDVSEITYNYTEDEVKKVLARYNGTNSDATAYGERNYNIYKIFEKYNKLSRESE